MACAVVLNYFFLASLVAMAGEAVVLYMDLVIVFREKTRSHVLKVAIITWGVLIVFHRLYIIHALVSKDVCECNSLLMHGHI